MFTKEDRSTFPYWFAHWCSYNMTALNLGAWKLKYLFHDIEKPFLKLFLPYNKVQKIHRTLHRHHFEWLENMLFAYEYGLTPERVKNILREYDFDATIIDWECNRFTKMAQPRNAYEEYKFQMDKSSFSEKYPLIAKNCYNEFSKGLIDSIKKLGLYSDN